LFDDWFGLICGSEDCEEKNTSVSGALRPDEVNSKVHETSALNNESRHGDNPKTS